MLINRRSPEVTWQLRFGGRKDRTTGRILMNFSAGICFESVEAFREQDVEEDISTLTVPIHFLHEDRELIEWNAEAPGTTAEMIQEIEAYALPFFQRYEKLPELLEALKSENPRDWFAVARNEHPELLAAVLAALGRPADARTVLEAAIEERQAKPPGHRLRFQRMLQRLG